MKSASDDGVAFGRLPDIAPIEILAHMSNPRIGAHMPLATFKWDIDAVAHFVAAKERYWRRDGLGHWALLYHGRYVGWGGFQKEGGEWDYGLVLMPKRFGLGPLITRRAIEFAVNDDRIPYVTFLLPPTRKRLGALSRLGAEFMHEIEYEGARFLQFRLNTDKQPRLSGAHA